MHYSGWMVKIFHFLTMMTNNSLPPAVLIQHGFQRKRATPVDREPVFQLRIHELIWLEYDTNDGFITLVRYSERIHHIDRIIIPKPVRSKQALKKLLSCIMP